MLVLTGGDTHGHAVAEAVAAYPDPGSAAAAIVNGTRNAQACDGQQALGTGREAASSLAVSVIDADVVRWRKQQVGTLLNWVCHGGARLRNNVVLQATACRGYGEGKVNVTTITDRMSARMGELARH